ncbi:MAG: S8 family serine peptidase [Bacillota bacterium]
MKRILAVMLALFMLIPFPLVAGAVSESKEQVSVIIGLSDEKGKDTVLFAGGKIEREFDFINAIQVKLPKSALNSVQKGPGIDYVEPDYPAKALAQTVPWGVERVNAPQVHSAGQKGSGVKVAILDTGIRTNHQDLTVYGGYDTTGTGSYNDNNGHGTHVAGTVAALDNTIGVLGVAPAARLYAVKVLDASGNGSYSNIIAGIQWAINNDMDIINMSLGGSSGSSALQNACNAAYNAGILLVAAAGNEGTASGNTECISYPARYSSVIAVGSITSGNVRSSFSSTGSTLELMAPGSSIYSTTYNGGYGTMSGTSMACPHVAGVAALIWGAKPSLTNVQLRNVLNATANDMWNDPWRYGNGLVDAWAAYQYVNGGPGEPDPQNLNVSISINYSYYYLYETMRMTVTVRDQNNALVPSAAVTLKLTTASGRVLQGNGSTNSSGTVTFTYTTTSADGRGYYTIEAFASKGPATGSATKTVRVY